jgi:hypothetical protein
MDLQHILGYAGAGLAGGNLWMIYSAVFKHAPKEKAPRSIDEWWKWFIGANQEIAAQHVGGKIPPDPTTAE